MKRAIFIVTHKRANTTTTYKLFKDTTYKVYHVVDNLDPEQSLYQDKFDNVLVFDKMEWVNKTDTFHNTPSTACVVYARNFVVDWAKRNAYDQIVIVDDDFKSFSLRYVQHDKLKSRKITRNVDGFLDAYLDYQNESGITIMSILSNALFMGGITNPMVVNGFSPKTCCMFFLDLHKFDSFKSYFIEDIITSVLNNKVGNMSYAVHGVSYDSAEVGAGNGGMAGAYAADSWGRTFLAVIAAPDITKMRYDGKQFKESVEWSNAFPKIISERYKK